MKRRTGIVFLLVLCCVWQVQAAVNCTVSGAGRFPDDEDTTCQNYKLCVYFVSSSNYVSYNYTCPSTSVFNPNTAMCTDPSNYVCNVTTSNSTNATSACTEEGFIADSSSTNCSTYIECVRINGAFSETTQTCPDATYYNPNTTFCESNYACPSNGTTNTFTCSSAGRFANILDTTCQTYYYCVLASNGTYILLEYTCPSTSVFNPNTRICTTSYSCTSTLIVPEPL